MHLEPASASRYAARSWITACRAPDRLPSFETEIVEVLSPTNPLGIKAGGEGGTTAAPAAIVSAIVDALAPYGIDDLKMPVTPNRIWQAIYGGKKSAIPE